MVKRKPKKNTCLKQSPIPSIPLLRRSKYLTDMIFEFCRHSFQLGPIRICKKTNLLFAWLMDWPAPNFNIEGT